MAFRHVKFDIWWIGSAYWFVFTGIKLDVSYIHVVTPTCIAFGLFASAGFEGLLSYIPFGYLPGEGR